MGTGQWASFAARTGPRAPCPDREPSSRTLICYFLCQILRRGTALPGRVDWPSVRSNSEGAIAVTIPAVAVGPLAATGLAGGDAGLAGIELLTRWRFGYPRRAGGARPARRIRAGHRREARERSFLATWRASGTTSVRNEVFSSEARVYELRAFGTTLRARPRGRGECRGRGRVLLLRLRMPTSCRRRASRATHPARGYGWHLVRRQARAIARAGWRRDRRGGARSMGSARLRQDRQKVRCASASRLIAPPQSFEQACSFRKVLRHIFECL